MTASPTESAKRAGLRTNRTENHIPPPPPPLPRKDKRDLAGADALDEDRPPSPRRRLRPAPIPTLRFTPTAWSKLLFLRDRGDTEVGGFGLALGPDPLCVTDIRLVRQVCSVVTVQFDDQSVAELFDEQVDQGQHPERFARIWVHTHPGDSPHPSSTDEETFARCFGRANWAVMFILARGGQTYARLRFNVGPGGTLLVPAEVDFGVPFPASDHEAWERDYLTHVDGESWFQRMKTTAPAAGAGTEPPPLEPDEFFEEEFEIWDTGFAEAEVHD